MADKELLRKWSDFFRKQFCYYCNEGGEDCYMEEDPHKGCYPCQDNACKLFDLWLREREIENAFTPFEFENGEDDDNPQVIALQEEYEACDTKFMDTCRKFSRYQETWAIENPDADIPHYAY